MIRAPKCVHEQRFNAGHKSELFIYGPGNKVFYSMAIHVIAHYAVEFSILKLYVALSKLPGHTLRQLNCVDEFQFRV
jgi:hypothetical protein